MTKNTHTPNVLHAFELLLIQAQINELYTQLDGQLEAFSMAFGPGRFDFELAEVGPSLIESGKMANRKAVLDLLADMQAKGPFFKVEITDNLEKLKTDGTIFKSTAFKAFSFSSLSLKRKPDSLKEAENE